jgi:hypothetical protein
VGEGREGGKRGRRGRRSFRCVGMPVITTNGQFEIAAAVSVPIQQLLLVKAASTPSPSVPPETSPPYLALRRRDLAQRHGLGQKKGGTFSGGSTAIAITVVLRLLRLALVRHVAVEGGASMLLK